MAISKNGKRPITVAGHLYLWKVFDEYKQGHFDGVQTMIVSADQDLIIRYGLGQADNNRQIWVQHERGEVSHFPSPKFENEDGTFTPANARALILWCLELNAK